MNNKNTEIKEITIPKWGFSFRGNSGDTKSKINQIMIFGDIGFFFLFFTLIGIHFAANLIFVWLHIQHL